MALDLFEERFDWADLSAEADGDDAHRAARRKALDVIRDDRGRLGHRRDAEGIAQCIDVGVSDLAEELEGDVKVLRGHPFGGKVIAIGRAEEAFVPVPAPMIREFGKLLADMVGKADGGEKAHGQWNHTAVNGSAAAAVTLAELRWTSTGEVMMARVSQAARLLVAVASVFVGTRISADAPADSKSGGAIFDMDTVVHRAGETTTKDNRKVPVGTAELVDGKVGKAVKFSFVEAAGAGFFSARVQPSGAWDEMAGFSFWVKGDGSKSWGGIELIDKDDYGLRYGYCFPIDSTEWRKVVVRWSDLTPELAGPMVKAKGGLAPSRFGTFSFGKWFFWREHPAQSFVIDQVMLEANIPAPPHVELDAGLARFRAKLARHEQVTIVTMGDSLTDEHHWANREVVWHKLLAKSLQEKYGSRVTIVNPAIGGTTLSQNMVLMSRWLADVPAPDLVTVWFGYNDWDSGVRWERFAEYLRVAVERIRQRTEGKADVLLITPCPGYERWETMKELERAVRDVAKEQKTGIANVAEAFRAAGSAEEALKRGYWASDKVHLGTRGHEVARDAVMSAVSDDPAATTTRN